MSEDTVAPNATRRWLASVAVYATVGVWVSFAILWLVWWLPVYVWRQSFTLFFYPAFLSVWLVLEIAAIVAVVSGAVALSLRAAPEKRGAVIVAVTAAAVFVLISFFALWFGNAPLALFGISIDEWITGVPD
ncbi:hypothetical protein [Agromyces albus]|uniref:Uncharacterized protein n=1 Tax=Agromyces albus TaxID=205332 RepID=A0A4Q2L4U8_9MICO|nr:hypothetical protein [Agromyces albus]RXZ73254.1 hypothetical protein ESP51_00695 [Agromyces albus]